MADTDPLNPEMCNEVLRVCGSFNLRKAARAVTQLYDDFLQPTGLRSTQVVVLVILAKEEEISMSRLARELMLSPSTLSRNLRPLERDGVLEIIDSGKRGKAVKLTVAGRQKLLDTVPYWLKAQEKFTTLVGGQAWGDLSEKLSTTVAALRSG